MPAIGTGWPASVTRLWPKKAMPPRRRSNQAITCHATPSSAGAREARTVSDLNHPHICTLHDIGHEEGVDFLVMELLEGRTLADRLAEGPVPADEALEYAVQVAEALDAAHSKNVIHRDLKPANVMLTKTGAKLLDFGLARASMLGGGSETQLDASPTMTSPLTAEGTILGTFQYMAPEQLEGKEADARSDIFAFGAVLYEMLTGKRAFAGDSQASLIASILKEDPNPVSVSMPRVPSSLDRVVSRCTAKNPDDRWQTTRDLAVELRWIRQAGDEPSPAETAKAGGTSWLPWAVAVLALLLAGFLALQGTSTSVNTTAPARRLMIPVPGATDFGVDPVGPPVVSPDGRHVVFGVMRKTRSSLWIRPFDDFVSRPLENTEGAVHPFWSPDSRHVGFFADGQLKRIEISTERVQTITESGGSRGGSWNSEGKILFVPNANTGVHLVHEGGGEVTVLTEPDPQVPDSSHRWPHFLPDGRHFLFVSWTNDLVAREQHGGLFVADLDGGAPERLLTDPSSAIYVPGHLMLMRDDNLVAIPFEPESVRVTGDPTVIASGVVYNRGTGHGVFSASLEGTLAYGSGVAFRPTTLAWYDRAGKMLTTVGEPAPYYGMGLAPDDRTAGATLAGEAGDGEIWLVDLERGGRRLLAGGPWDVNHSIFSTTGDRVLYGSQQAGKVDLYAQRADGSGEPVLILADQYDKEPYDWSADGRYIAYFPEGASPGPPGIWIYDIEEQQSLTLISGNRAFYGARFSPDGRWIAYVSEESGRPEVFVQAFETDGGIRTGGRWQVSIEGGVSPHWRDDNGELIFRDLDQRVMAVSVAAQPGDLKLGTPQHLFTLNDVIAVGEPSADHQRFLIGARDESDSEPIHVVLNWTADLE